tara:strand:+ start:7518 stop:7661 length:144 start_codon:yes stop_codon:yes gene_type:complete
MIKQREKNLQLLKKIIHIEITLLKEILIDSIKIKGLDIKSLILNLRE